MQHFLHFFFARMPSEADYVIISDPETSVKPRALDELTGSIKDSDHLVMHALEIKGSLGKYMIYCVSAVITILVTEQ